MHGFLENQLIPFDIPKRIPCWKYGPRSDSQWLYGMNTVIANYVSATFSGTPSKHRDSDVDDDDDDNNNKNKKRENHLVALPSPFVQFMYSSQYVTELRQILLLSMYYVYDTKT